MDSPLSSSITASLSHFSRIYKSFFLFISRIDSADFRNVYRYYHFIDFLVPRRLMPAFMKAHVKLVYRIVS